MLKTTSKTMTIFSILFIALGALARDAECKAGEGAKYKVREGANMIYLNPMEEFSGLMVEEILKKRINAVKNSALWGDNYNYTPDKRVFQIEDGLQWLSAYELACKGIDKTQNIGQGNSRESISILNPELLLTTNIPSYGFEASRGCSEVDYLFPQNAQYDETSNTITIYVDYSSFYRKNKRFYEISLGDANARDMGYSYVYADETENIKFKQRRNLSTDVNTTKGFYHKGYSCRLKEGCNNYSPHDANYEFILTELPARIHMKLWQQKPHSKDNEADINYEMIFN